MTHIHERNIYMALLSSNKWAGAISEYLSDFNTGNYAKVGVR